MIGEAGISTGLCESKVAAMLFGRKGRNQQLLPKANAAITIPLLA